MRCLKPAPFRATAKTTSFLRPLPGARALPMNRGLAARLGILAIAVVAALGSVRGQVSADDASETERQSAIRMQRFVVAATRIQRNPWRYTSADGIEVLTRASEHDTDWWIDALRRGRWLEDKVMPADWLPRPQVPYTVIIDDTDLATVPTSELHALPLSLHAPDDPLTWDYLSKVTSLSTDYIGSYDSDTLALNTNVNGNDTTGFNYGSMTLERLSRNQPPLPRWLLNGILAENFGIFREGYDLLLGLEEVQPRRIVKAAGPGTLWVSTEETKRMLEMLRKNRHDPKVEIAPLDMLFSEAPLRDQNLALWQSESALFARWGLMGPGRSDPAMYHAFQELVRRGRSEPITEAVFAQCFGFGYAAMKVRLDAFLQDVIAKPTSVKWDMPSEFLQSLQLKEATSDQIGRILEI